MIQLVKVLELKVGDIVLANDVRPGGSTRGTVVRVNRDGVVVQWPSGSSIERNYPEGYGAGRSRPSLIRREVLDD